MYMRGQLFVGQMFYVYEGTNIYRTNTVTCVCDNTLVVGQVTCVCVVGKIFVGQ